MITTSSRPSSSSAPSVIRSPPPKEGPLPTATSIASRVRLRAVEVERVVQRLEHPQLGQGGEVVAHLALGPGHPVGPLVDQRVEAGGQHRREVLGRRTGPGRPSGSRPRSRSVRGGHRVLARQVEVAGHVVAGAGRDDPQRVPVLGDRLHARGGPCRRPPSTTSASTPSATAARARSRASSASRPLRSRTISPAPRSRSQHRPARPAALALARGRVGQQGDLAGHARRLAVLRVAPRSAQPEPHRPPGADRTPTARRPG